MGTDDVVKIGEEDWPFRAAAASTRVVKMQSGEKRMRPRGEVKRRQRKW